MEYNEEHKNKIWEMKKKIENKSFKSFDFSGTLFNYPIFDNVQFEDCLFNKSDITDARLYGCSFINCRFIKIDFRTATIGAHEGLFKNCRFDNCDFRDASFYEPKFNNCEFNKCKLRNVDFKASSFESCKFVGKLSNVIFRGNDESDLYSNPKPNSMYHIDFSEAVFGEYVDFEGCDLSTCVPPKGETFEGLLSRSEYYPNRLGTGCKNCQL